MQKQFFTFFIFIFSLFRIVYTELDINGKFSEADSMKHKVYFGHSLERCQVTPGEFSDYAPFSHH